MPTKPGRLMAWTLAVLGALGLGLYAGYKVGFGVRDYQAARETIARKADLETANTELLELRLRLALINAELASMVRDTGDRLGVDLMPSPCLSEGD